MNIPNEINKGQSDSIDTERAQIEGLKKEIEYLRSLREQRKIREKNSPISGGESPVEQNDRNILVPTPLEVSQSYNEETGRKRTPYRLADPTFGVPEVPSEHDNSEQTPTTNNTVPYGVKCTDLKRKPRIPDIGTNISASSTAVPSITSHLSPQSESTKLSGKSFAKTSTQNTGTSINDASKFEMDQFLMDEKRAKAHNHNVPYSSISTSAHPASSSTARPSKEKSLPSEENNKLISDARSSQSQRNDQERGRRKGDRKEDASGPETSHSHHNVDESPTILGSNNHGITHEISEATQRAFMNVTAPDLFEKLGSSNHRERMMKDDLIVQEMDTPSHHINGNSYNQDNRESLYSENKNQLNESDRIRISNRNILNDVSGIDGINGSGFGDSIDHWMVTTDNNTFLQEACQSAVSVVAMENEQKELQQNHSLVDYPSGKSIDPFEQNHLDQQPKNIPVDNPSIVSANIQEPRQTALQHNSTIIDYSSAVSTDVTEQERIGLQSTNTIIDYPSGISVDARERERIGLQSNTIDETQQIGLLAEFPSGKSVDAKEQYASRQIGSLAEFPSGKSADAKEQYATQNRALADYPSAVSVDAKEQYATQNRALADYPSAVSVDAKEQYATQNRALADYPSAVSVDAKEQYATQNRALADYPSAVSVDAHDQYLQSLVHRAEIGSGDLRHYEAFNKKINMTHDTGKNMENDKLKSNDPFHIIANQDTLFTSEPFDSITKYTERSNKYGTISECGSPRLQSPKSNVLYQSNDSSMPQIASPTNYSTRPFSNLPEINEEVIDDEVKPEESELPPSPLIPSKMFGPTGVEVEQSSKRRRARSKREEGDKDSPKLKGRGSASFSSSHFGKSFSTDSEHRRSKKSHSKKTEKSRDESPKSKKVYAPKLSSELRSEERKRQKAVLAENAEQRKKAGLLGRRSLGAESPRGTGNPTFSTSTDFHSNGQQKINASMEEKQKKEQSPKSEAYEPELVNGAFPVARMEARSQRAALLRSAAGSEDDNTTSAAHVPGATIQRIMYQNDTGQLNENAISKQHPEMEEEEETESEGAEDEPNERLAVGTIKGWSRLSATGTVRSSPRSQPKEDIENDEVMFKTIDECKHFLDDLPEVPQDCKVTFGQSDMVNGQYNVTVMHTNEFLNLLQTPHTEVPESTLLDLRQSDFFAVEKFLREVQSSSSEFEVVELDLDGPLDPTLRFDDLSEDDDDWDSDEAELGDEYAESIGEKDLDLDTNVPEEEDPFPEEGIGFVHSLQSNDSGVQQTLAEKERDEKHFQESQSSPVHGNHDDDAIKNDDAPVHGNHDDGIKNQSSQRTPTRDEAWRHSYPGSQPVLVNSQKQDDPLNEIDSGRIPADIENREVPWSDNSISHDSDPNIFQRMPASAASAPLHPEMSATPTSESSVPRTSVTRIKKQRPTHSPPPVEKVKATGEVIPPPDFGVHDVALHDALHADYVFPKNPNSINPPMLESTASQIIHDITEVPNQKSVDKQAQAKPEDPIQTGQEHYMNHDQQKNEIDIKNTLNQNIKNEGIISRRKKSDDIFYIPQQPDPPEVVAQLMEEVRKSRKREEGSLIPHPPNYESSSTRPRHSTEKVSDTSFAPPSRTKVESPWNPGAELPEEEAERLRRLREKKFKQLDARHEQLAQRKKSIESSNSNVVHDQGKDTPQPSTNHPSNVTKPPKQPLSTRPLDNNTGIRDRSSPANRRGTIESMGTYDGRQRSIERGVRKKSRQDHRSNRKVIKLALNNLLQGEASRSIRESLLATLETEDFRNEERFVILFRGSHTGRHDFRALYCFRDNKWQRIIYLLPSPTVIEDGMALSYFRFDSAAREFKQLENVTQISSVVDALFLKAQYLKSKVIV